jgi:hypothetical protein
VSAFRGTLKGGGVKQKTPKQKIKARLDKLVKKIVKLRDNNTCQFSGQYAEGANCHASHVIPVSADGRLAFDPLNLKVLTFHNHMHWWHKNPVEAGEWFQKKFPERWAYLSSMHKLNKTIGPITMTEYEEMEERLKQELSELTKLVDAWNF